jgi:mannose-6-phosphate isomerase-like protein (cupin superfamily)
MTVKSRANAEHYVWGEVCDGWRLLARPDLSVTEERIPPGRGERRHYHERARQLFFVLEGGLELEIDGAVHRLLRGDSLEIEPRRPHRVWNPHADDARFLVISAPTTAGDRVDVDGEP